MALEDQFVLEMVAEADRPPHFLTEAAMDVPQERYRQFGLADMVGERIMRAWKIKNPREYDPEVESPNPEYFDVIEFESGGFLLVEAQGWDDGTTYHSFYYDTRSTRYADGLFDRID